MTNYGSKMIEKMERRDDILHQITEMEQRETDLLSKLTHTQNQERHATSELDNLVKGGYDYYSDTL